MDDMGPLIQLVLVLAVLVIAGMLLFRTARQVPPASGRRVRPVDALPAAPAHRGPWQARYLLDGDTTVWAVVRTVTDARGEWEETQAIVRIDSGAADFDELFVAGERRAHERALLLNSSLSP
jgi:hypothetical protein